MAPTTHPSALAHGYTLDHLEVDPSLDEQPAEDLKFQRGGDGVEAADAITDVNGRKYHGLKAGTYWLPNDQQEQDRLNYQHRLVTLVLEGKLGLAPVEKPKTVLDVATGTGIWALEYAQQHPEADVYGSDLSEIQPKLGLPNCHFVTSDVEKDDWSFPVKFDYVHLRYIVTCFDDPKLVIRKAYDSMNSGGYIEFYDAVIGFQKLEADLETTPVAEWMTLLHNATALQGRDLSKPWKYKDWVKEAGFVDVVEKPIAQSVGPWPKDPHQKKIGIMVLADVEEIMLPLKKMMVAGGVPQETADDATAKAVAAVQDPSQHLYCEGLVVYGRKP